MAYYKNPKVDNKDCCDDDTNEQDPHCTDCVDSWKKEQKEADNILIEVSAELAKVTAKNTNELAWNTKLKKYLDGFESTDKMVKEIKKEIYIFKEHLQDVCKYSNCTINALEFLSCRVWSNYHCLNTLWTKLDDFENEIKALKDPALDSGSVLKCIADYKAKVKIAREAVEIAIPKVLDALNAALAIYEMICSKCQECECGDANEACACGLVSNLETLHDLLYEATAIVEDCTPCETSKFCHVTFPLFNKNNESNNAIVNDTQQKLLQSEEKIGKLRTELQKLTKEKDAAQFRANGLTKAILAASEAQKC